MNRICLLMIIFDHKQWICTTAVVFLFTMVSIGIPQPSYGMPCHGLGLLREVGAWVNDKNVLGTQSEYLHEEGSSKAYARLVQTKHTPAKHVGAVMALLATFDQANVLPPESSPKANQLIRSLIQFQSAFMNQESQVVQQYVSEALSSQLGQDGVEVSAQFSANGWNAKSMEGLVDYSTRHPFWDKPEIREALSRYNLSSGDWDLVVETFTQARDQFRKNGQDLQQVFAVQRQSMPGGR